MNNKGYTIKEVLTIIAVFSVIYIIAAIAVSHAFVFTSKDDEYANVINVLEKQAVLYAEENEKKLFKDSDDITIYANDLVEKKYYNASEGGNIQDPRDTSHNLNDLKIEIKKTDDGIVAKVMP